MTKEERAAYMKAWREKHPDYQRHWRERYRITGKEYVTRDVFEKASTVGYLKTCTLDIFSTVEDLKTCTHARCGENGNTVTDITLTVRNLALDVQRC